MTEPLIKDHRTITAEQLRSRVGAKVLSFAEALPFLASPDRGVPLRVTEDGGELTDGDSSYPIVDGIPILYPDRISAAFLGGGLDLKYHEDPKLQYFLLSQIKQRGEINAPSTNVHYERHLFRMSECVQGCRGSVLDVGCDNVDISAALFNGECTYIGMDPFSGFKAAFRLVGVGEALPLRDESVDNVVFNTSLDHILDYHQALDEARRVLKPGGHLYLSTLLWSSGASLLNDLVHFHHFREYEIFGALSGMSIERVTRYSYKDDSHRYGLYLAARKP